ncbi:restriction endonuclease subunit S [Acidaminobacter hydrogenoformans]|uniref:Type I restriction enzyme, S subunit n=1 Tax=Acidaminobacter hydrogenoformans DSM 2784 TaxID=1120920 RepID=A0A1G5S5W3_9FIRM|nr:restriction endonuclease subunit S [Acidaminobacter hydrogenoformans]SCZ81588.1 type I restriction enzyme, S subunit [Acidaminobacter hydrogenoformans DSM 2784]
MGKKKSRELTQEEWLEQALVPESEWPYKVPGNWVWVRGEHIFKPMTSKKPEGEYFSYIDIESIDNLNQQVNKVKKLKVSDAPSRASRELYEGDTLFSLVRPYLMNIAFITEEFAQSIASTGFYVCRPTSILNNRYLFRLMTSNYVVNGLNSYMKGDNSPSIRSSDIQGFYYPIPPVAEQQRIVDRIESLFEKLDQAKGIIQEALDSFENRRAAILYKAFSGELTKKWREENGVGMESWETLKLRQCGNWCGGGTPSKSRKDYWENGNIPWVSPKDMKSMYIDNAIDKITQTAINESSTRLVPEGAILIVVRSGILRRILPIAITRTQVTLNQDMKALIPKGINAKYLYWLFVSKEASIRTKCAKSGTTVESISSKLLYEYEITIPPIHEQVQIAQILDDIFDNEINAQTLMDAIEDVDVMKKSILARTFRGELGTNDPIEVNEIFEM